MEREATVGRQSELATARRLRYTNQRRGSDTHWHGTMDDHWPVLHLDFSMESKSIKRLDDGQITIWRMQNSWLMPSCGCDVWP